MPTIAGRAVVQRQVRPEDVGAAFEQLPPQAIRNDDDEAGPGLLFLTRDVPALRERHTQRTKVVRRHHPTAKLAWFTKTGQRELRCIGPGCGDRRGAHALTRGEEIGHRNSDLSTRVRGHQEHELIGPLVRQISPQCCVGDGKCHRSRSDRASQHCHRSH